MPQSVPVGQSYLRLKIEEGDYSETFSWPLKIDNFAPPAQRPKHTPLGLWDYSYSRANNEIAAKGIAALFRHSGISFTSKASGTVYRDALQTAGIKTGGYTHHGYFSNKKFPDPQAVISAPASALIPGVKQLVSNAKNGNGIASMDYEPTGRSGFNASAISKFKQRYNVSEADFTQFRDYVAKHRLETFKATDPLIQKIWKQWTEFRTKQTEEYISRLHEEFQKQMPNGRLLITSSRSYGKDSLRTLALGCDNAAMAQYADIMMPQIYCGYGGAAAKLAMQMTHGWKQEIKKQGSKSQLWPLLLVRYAGAKSGNSPQRLRQQIIGSLAHGADGISLYFPGIMDATYWKMLARTTEDIAKYEDYYQSGKRVSDAFSLNGLPQGIVQVNMWPDYNETVKNPGWSFTAHQLGSKVLLTLINLQEANDLVFDINIGKTKVLSSQNTEKSGNHQWLVAPGQIGFIMLEGE